MSSKSELVSARMWEIFSPPPLNSFVVRKATPLSFSTLQVKNERSTHGATTTRPPRNGNFDIMMIQGLSSLYRSCLNRPLLLLLLLLLLLVL